MEKECDHDWDFSIPYAPSSDGNYVHVEVEAYCTKCGKTLSSDYSWDVTEYNTVIEEGSKVYECDQCGTEMIDEGDFRQEISDSGYDPEDTHICSEECYKVFFDIDEEE